MAFEGTQWCKLWWRMYICLKDILLTWMIGYLYFENVTAFCDCPSLYGLMDPSSNCTSFSAYTYVWVISTVILLICAIVVFVYNLFTSQIHKAIHWSTLSKPPIKVWSIAVLGYLFLLASLVCRLLDIFLPGETVVIVETKRSPFTENESLKTTVFLNLYSAFFAAYLFLALVLILETGNACIRFHEQLF